MSKILDVMSEKPTIHEWISIAIEEIERLNLSEIKELEAHEIMKMRIK